jgi:hypothetical protein
MKPLFFILLALLVVPTLAHAFTVGENSSIVITTTNGTDLRNVTTLNLSIYYDNVTNLWRAGEFITPTLDGIYIDYVTFNVSGRYIAVADINDTGLIYRRFIYIEVDEGLNMTPIAIIIGILGLIAYILYLAKDTISKPALNDPAHRELLKWFNPRNLAVSLTLLSSWIVLSLLALIVLMADGTTYSTLLKTVFYVMLLVIGAFNCIYFILYMMFVTKTQIQGMGKLR